MTYNQLTLEIIRSDAAARGGQCLSEKYINAITPLIYKCQYGHIFKATANRVRCGHWCMQCAGNKRQTINDCREVASERNGECLSTEYINCKKPMKWKCEHGHIWYTSFDSVKHGSWCQQCGYFNSGISRRLSIDDMHVYAQKKRGKCLSTVYINMHTKLKWQCEFGHIWYTEPNCVRYSSWCSECGVRVLENECRRIFTKLFKLLFPKRRPFWLINPKTRWRLELDGYNEELKLAFEYNGLQHYRCTDKFGGEVQFERLKFRDDIKRQLCLEHGIALIIIPHNIKMYKLENYIISELRKVSRFKGCTFY